MVPNTGENASGREWRNLLYHLEPQVADKSWRAHPGLVLLGSPIKLVVSMSSKFCLQFISIIFHTFDEKEIIAFFRALSPSACISSPMGLGMSQVAFKEPSFWRVYHIITCVICISYYMCDYCCMSCYMCDYCRNVMIAKKWITRNMRYVCKIDVKLRNSSQHWIVSSSPVPSSAFLAAPRNSAEREALAERYCPCAFCDKAQSSGDGRRLWHLKVVALTFSRDP